MLTTCLAAVLLSSALKQAAPTSSASPLQPLEAGRSNAGGTPDASVLRLLMDGHVRIELLDERGKRHKASLLRTNGNDLVLWIGHQSITVPADQLQVAERRGDRPWDGALMGLGVGLGLAAMVSSDSPNAGLEWTSNNPDDWTLQDSIGLVCFSTALGFVIDTLHVGTHKVLVGPMQSKSSSKVDVALAGPAHDRRLQVGYRLAF